MYVEEAVYSFSMLQNSLQKGLRKIGNVFAEVWKIREYFS
jgi:hypothetical protein